MSDIDKQLLLDLITSPEVVLGSKLKTTMKNLGYKVHQETQNKYIMFEHESTSHANRDVLPVFVAHLDTVSESSVAPLQEEIIMATKKELDGTETEIWSLSPGASSTVECLGGDDRAGVYVILKVLSKLKADKSNFRPRVLYTYGEETGCIGSRNFVNDIVNKDFATPFMLQFDRRNDGVVFYETKNKDFQELISKVYNKPIEFGSTTDIRQFQEKYHINSANISVGFKAEHTRTETINHKYLQKAIDGTLRLVQNENLVFRLSTLDWEITKQTYSYEKTTKKSKSNWDLKTDKSTKKKETYVTRTPELVLKDFYTVKDNLDKLGMYLEIYPEAKGTVGDWISIIHENWDEANQKLTTVSVEAYVDKQFGTARISATLPDKTSCKLVDLKEYMTTECHQEISKSIFSMIQVLNKDMTDYLEETNAKEAYEKYAEDKGIK